MVLHEPDLGASLLIGSDAPASCVVGRWRITHDAEHDWDQLRAPDQSWAATVFVPATAFGRAEVAVVAADGPHLLPEGARVFRYPGDDGLPEELTVGDLLATTAIDEVLALGGTQVQDHYVIRTQHFLRPTMTAGRLRLVVRPGEGSTLLGFEQPNPTPCCAGH